jgi:hypothetical protein
LLIPYNNDLQFFNIDDKSLETLKIKDRNFVLKSGTDEPPQTHVKSFCLTPDRKDLITYEELIDSNSHKDIYI